MNALRRMALVGVTAFGVLLLPGCQFMRNLFGLGGEALTVEGTVYDASTNETLAGAKVEAPDTETHSDSAGHFAFPLTAGQGVVDMTVTLAGYESHTEQIDTNAEGQVSRDVYLAPDASGQADISIDSLGAPSVATPGSVISVVAVISNVGGAATPPSPSLSFYLSTNASIETQDQFLGAEIHAGVLDPGHQATVSSTLALPASLDPGSHYVGVLYQGDTFTENNTRSAPIGIQDGADLAVTQVSTTVSVAHAGDTLFGSVSIRNQGNLDVTTAFDVTIYLSQDATIDPGTDVAAGQYTINGLDSGSGPTVSGPIGTVPAGIATGTWYLGAVADSGDVVDEVDESNNSGVADTTITIGDIDLSILAFDPPSTFDPSVSENVPITIANLGDSDSGSFQLWVYLSADDTVSGDDLNLTTGSRPSIAAYGDNTGTVSLALPGYAPGSYFLIAVADGAELIVEPDEANNVWASPITLTGADLAIASVSPGATSVRSGGNWFVLFTVENIGTSYAADFSVAFYLSDDGVLDALDLLVGTKSEFGLSIGSRDSSANPTIPLTVPVGTYTLLLAVDDDEDVVEMDETNNVFDAGSLEVTRPDLYISNVAAPISAVLGTSFSVQYRLGNEATATFGGILSGVTFQVWVYLSEDTTFGAPDLLLGGGTFQSTPQPGSYLNSSLTTSIPAGTASGSYYVGVVVDPGDTVPEIDEGNNVDYDTGPVTVTAPELVVDTIGTVPGSVYLGEQLSLSTTLRNDGDAPSGTTFNVGYRWSTDPTFSSTSYLQYFPSSSWGSVPAGGSASYAPTLTVLTWMPAGTYYLRVETDTQGYLAESNEGNNTYIYSSPITVNQSDYEALSITGPASANRGTVISVTFNVQNAGSYTVPGFNYKLYLSDNTDPDIAGDTEIGSGFYNNILGSTQGASIPKNVMVPEAFPTGTFYLKGFVESGGSYSESDETNNVAVSFSTITITAP